VAGVATTLLGVAALPRVLPSQHTVSTLSAAASRSARIIEDAIRAHTAPQPVAASMSIRNDPELLQPAAPEELLQRAALEELPPPSAADIALLAATDVPAPQPNPPQAPIDPKVAPARAAVTPTRAAAPNATPVVAAARPNNQSPVTAPAFSVLAPQGRAAAIALDGAKTLAAGDAKPLPPELQVSPVPPREEGLPESPIEAAASAAEIALSTLPAAPAPTPVLAPKMVGGKPLQHAPARFARIDVSAERLPPGVSRSSLRAALNQVALLSCYTQAQQRSQQLELPGTALELKTNTSGRIVWAHVTNGELPQALRECLEQVARSGNIRTGEGGEAQATLRLLPSR
jgi:hypothetical protein